MKLLYQYKTLLIALLLQVHLLASAQLYSTANNGGYMRGAEQNAYVTAGQNQAPSYTPYRSTVYEPFSNVTPSQRAPISRPNEGAVGDVEVPDIDDPDDEIPDDFGNVDDPGDALPLSGELWVLLVFAALATILKTIKLRKQEI